MIKQALFLSLVYMAATTAAPSSCPTCPKGYAVSAVEEVLLPIKQKKVQQPSSTNSKPQTLGTKQQKSPVEEIANQQRSYSKQSPAMPAPSLSHAPRRDSILSATRSHARNHGYIYSTDTPNPARSTYDVNMAYAHRAQMQGRK